MAPGHIRPRRFVLPAIVLGLAGAAFMPATPSAAAPVVPSGPKVEIDHADGATYHPLPNRGAFETQGAGCVSSYGVDAMRQLFILQKWIS